MPAPVLLVLDGFSSSNPNLIERVNDPAHNLCTIVFGQGHTEGLIKALGEQGQKSGLGPVGIIVIEPFDL